MTSAPTPAKRQARLKDALLHALREPSRTGYAELDCDLATHPSPAPDRSNGT
jgi:hypothetical protein